MNTYYTQSLNIAAYLKFKGFKILNSETIKNITTFYFERTDSLNQAIKDYNNDTELKMFITAFREVKEMIKK
jgi:hypothetical protein